MKLILLRGNSGSGKSTTAKALQKKLGHGTMLVSQDVVRREMLYVKDGTETEASKLLLELVLYGKRNGHTVILEGILNAKWYRSLFSELKKAYGDNILAYYFDLPFEETLRRHQYKPNAHEFGEKEMREWWNEKDLLEDISEECIKEDLSFEEVVEKIYKEVILK